MTEQKTTIHFDIESTGTDTVKDRIIQLSLIKTPFGSKAIIEKKKLLLSNCNVPIHPMATKAHGLTEVDLIGKPSFASYSEKILEYLNSADFLAGYNIKSFDIPMLSEEFGRCGIDWTPKPAIDSCVIFKRREKRTLGAALMFYCGKDIKGAHDAENDVLASIDVLDGQSFMYGIETEDELLNESCYEGEEKRLDFLGKIILNDDLKPVWSFGKNQGKLVLSDRDYCDWVLRNDFAYNTKKVLRSLLNQPK